MCSLSPEPLILEFVDHLALSASIRGCQAFRKQIGTHTHLQIRTRGICRFPWRMAGFRFCEKKGSVNPTAYPEELEELLRRGLCKVWMGGD